MISFQDVTDLSNHKSIMNINDYSNYSSLIGSNKIIDQNANK